MYIYIYHIYIYGLRNVRLKKKKFVNDVLRKLSNRFRVIEKSIIYSINGLDCIIPRIIETGAGQLNAISLMVVAA